MKQALKRIKELLWQLTQMEPVAFKAAVMAVVALLGSLGIVVSPDIPDTALGVFIPLVALIQAVWTRRAVTPNAKVVVMMPNPADPTVVAPGAAVPNLPSYEDIVDAAYDTPRS